MAPSQFAAVSRRRLNVGLQNFTLFFTMWRNNEASGCENATRFLAISHGKILVDVERRPFSKKVFHCRGNIAASAQDAE